MPRPLKVYGLCRDGHNRVIVAASTMKEAAALVQVSMYHFSRFACPTGNEEEIATALSKPRTPFYRNTTDHRGPYREGLKP